MFENKSGMRIFWLSFLITVIITVFLLSLFWVELRAQDNGFGGFPIEIKIERKDELHYDMTIAKFSGGIDLTEIDRAASALQQTERWMFPREVRTLSRIVIFAAEQLKDNRRDQREQEFFRNAGLV